MSDERLPLVLFTAGGTGGHVYPALAVAKEVAARGYRIAWIGTRAGLEATVVPQAGIDIHYLPVRGVRGKSVIAKLGAMFFLMLAIARASWLLLRLRPECVVGMGGYAAGPAGIAAWMLRKPLLIHEQNAVAGTTNRILAPFAGKIVAAFEGAFAEKRKVFVTGNPVRSEVVQSAAEWHYDYRGQRPLRLLVLGGSLGAVPINEVIPGALRRLEREHPDSIELWHQTGRAHFEEMQHRYDGFEAGTVRVDAFIEDMAAAYSWADLVLSRAGALTVSELSVSGTPAIFVPLPHAIDDHQKLNALSLTTAGGAVLLLQSELDAHRLSQRLAHFVAHPDELRAMSVATYREGTPGATQIIADYCEELMNAR